MTPGELRTPDDARGPAHGRVVIAPVVVLGDPFRTPEHTGLTAWALSHAKEQLLPAKGEALPVEGVPSDVE